MLKVLKPGSTLKPSIADLVALIREATTIGAALERAESERLAPVSAAAGLALASMGAMQCWHGA